jgi:5S rRNA maturation endonuclease (ribonuclease M5)
VTHSFAGDDWKACRDHVRTKLGLPDPKLEPKNGKAEWTVLDEYIYYDQNGERYLKVRKCRDSNGKKQFPQYHWDGHGWSKGKPDGPKIPYRLPEMIAAPTTATIYFVEGEKDADALAKIGFVATTASEGAAAKFDSALTPFFKDRHVLILPDADRPGRAHAQKVAKAIHSVAASVRILDLYPDRHDGSDVSDFIAHDTAGVRLAKEVKEAPLSRPSGTVTSAAVAANGAELLSDVYAFLGRFVAYPSVHAHVAHTLWNVHAHSMEAWDSTPRIAFLSPEPGSGKTRALEVSELLVPNPVEAVNVTPAYLFRKVGAEEGPPTILYDEIDTVFGPKAKDNEEIRGLLNAGHRRGAVAGRCVVRGKIVETEEIPAYCAVALAGLGWLPDTLMSRSIVIRMRRRGPSESVEPYRRRDEIDEGHGLRDRLAGWAAAKAKILFAARPAMPPGIEDRNADVWEALFAVADAAGGVWPKLAREAAVALIAAGREQEPSLGIRLLADLRTVFWNTEAAFTEAILIALHALEEAPWKDLNKRRLDSRGLSLRLRQYGIKSKQIREGSISKKGYRRADLADAWARYLSSSPTSETSETAETTQHIQTPRVSDVSDSSSAVSDATPDVSDWTPNPSLNGGLKQAMKSTSVSDVSDVSLLTDAAFSEVGPYDVPDAGWRKDQDDIPTDQTCAQCNGAIDGTERMVSVSGHTVWLHETCERFWIGFVAGER